MTYYLAENPWYLAGALGLVAAGFLIALKVTQDGRNLIRALVALGLAALVLLVEQLWVTDAERIEWVVKAVAAAVGRSDGDAVLSHMDSRVTFSMRNSQIGEDLDLGVLSETLKQVTFDYLHVSRLTASAGERTHRGSAEFRVGVGGTYRMPLGARNFAGFSEWSLGFRKLPGGEWKVTRITAVVVPPYAYLPMFRFRPRPTSSAPSSGNASEVGPPSPSSLREVDRERPFGVRGRTGR